MCRRSWVGMRRNVRWTGRQRRGGEAAGLDEVEGRKLHWYYVMTLTVVGTSVLAFVVMVVVVVGSFEDKVKRNEGAQEDQEGQEDQEKWRRWRERPERSLGKTSIRLKEYLTAIS